MEDKLGIALIKYACPICGEVNEDATAIALNKKLTKKAAQEIKSMHDKVVGFSDKPCKKCQSYIDKGAFFIIGIDKDKTDDWSNPYRTGHIVGIKKDSDFYRSLPDEYKTKEAMFMDYRQMQKIGMF